MTEDISIKEKAEEKIKGEHKEFKEKIEKMKPGEIYNMSGIIIFTEATIFHLKQLINSEELCNLIVKDGKTLEGAVNYIISKVRMKYGQMGDLPVEEFHEFIWDYYKIEPIKAKEAMEIKIKKVEGTKLVTAEQIKARIQNAKQNIKKPSPKAGPLQTSLFDFGGDL